MNANDGLVYAYTIKPGRGQPMEWKHIRNWRPETGYLWLHLDYKNPEAKAWLLEESGIDTVYCDALLAEETRPRLISCANAVLLILRGVNCNAGADPEDMVSIRLWIEKDRVISMRHRRVKAIESVNDSILSGQPPVSTSDFLTMLSNALVDRMGDVISEIDDQVDELEDLVLTEQSHELRPKLADLRRQSISLRRYISPQRDVLARLQNDRLPWLDELARMRLREVAERTARFVDDLDAARDRAAITQEELNSRLSEQTNKTLYILSIVTALFLPLGFITGLLGINVGGMPGVENPFAFSIVVFILTVFVAVQLILFRKKHWL